MHIIEINSLNDLDRAAKEFIDVTPGLRKFAFYGPMGSGKTTLIKAICRKLGATGVVTSPTFSLINEYPMENGGMIYHFDLYRIDDPAELFDIGFEEYIYSENYVFIEWADKAGSFLPDGAVSVTLQETGMGSRLVTIDPK